MYEGKGGSKLTPTELNRRIESLPKDTKTFLQA